MPIYEFRCKICGHKFESLCRLSDLTGVECPCCGAREFSRLMSGFSTIGAGARGGSSGSGSGGCAGCTSHSCATCR